MQSRSLVLPGQKSIYDFFKKKNEKDKCFVGNGAITSGVANTAVSNTSIVVPQTIASHVTSRIPLYTKNDYIDPLNLSAKMPTNIVAHSTIPQTTTVDPDIQKEILDMSMSNDNQIEKQTSDFENDTIKIENETVLIPSVFKTLCFYKPTSNGKFLCKLKHEKTKRKSIYNPDYTTLRVHLRMAHNLSATALSNLTEYSSDSIFISLTSLVK